jgi:hypothetical protein
LDSDTFYRLAPEHARALTAVNAATLMLVWPSFLAFPHLPTSRIPTSIQQFVSSASDGIRLRLGVPYVLNAHMSSITNHMNPALIFLWGLTGNV